MRKVRTGNSNCRFGGRQKRGGGKTMQRQTFSLTAIFFVVTLAGCGGAALNPPGETGNGSNDGSAGTSSGGGATGFGGGDDAGQPGSGNGSGNGGGDHDAEAPPDGFDGGDPFGDDGGHTGPPAFDGGHGHGDGGHTPPTFDAGGFPTFDAGHFPGFDAGGFPTFDAGHHGPPTPDGG
jgi:hypothetical protein